MSGKYILSTAELGYLTQKNMSLAFLRCMGVRVDEWGSVKDPSFGKEVWLESFAFGAYPSFCR
jgi:hypothetical protein